VSLEALIFDVDGTLGDTEEAHRAGFNDAFDAMGLGWHWNRTLYRELLGVAGGRERIRHFVDDYGPLLPEGVEREALIGELHRIKNLSYVATVAGGQIPLRPGIKRLIAEARAAGVKLAVATTTTPENVRQLLLSALGPESIGWFDTIEDASSVSRKKPYPDVYLAAIDHLGLTADSCLAVEDSRLGLTAARGAGIATIVTVNQWTEGEDFSGAIAVVSDLGDPGNPAAAIANQMHGREFVDLELLRRWHRSATD
jgi:HAD superfamily hydrolase (TIGR01509 family)